MESLLVIWIEDVNQKRIPVDTATIKQKAISIYKKILVTEPTTSSAQQRKTEFIASGGWFFKFLERHDFHNLRLKCEIASANMTTSQNYPLQLKKLFKMVVTRQIKFLMLMKPGYF